MYDLWCSNENYAYNVSYTLMSLNILLIQSFVTSLDTVESLKFVVALFSLDSTSPQIYILDKNKFLFTKLHPQE